MDSNNDWWVGVEAKEKLFYFRHFFVGRDDIYAQRDPRDGRYWLQRKALNDSLIIQHMRGEKMLGSYPLQDKTTKWVAADFDNHNKNAFEQAKIFIETLRKYGIEPICNTSQSGNGIHVRLIFEDPRQVAIYARRFMLTMIEAAELQKISDGGAFDRLFPSQDTLRDETSIGNQIAMPLNLKAARERGGSMLLDRQYQKIQLGEDTWEAIRTYKLIKRIDMFDAVQAIGRAAYVFGNMDEDGNLVHQQKGKAGGLGNRSDSSYKKEDLNLILTECGFMKRVCTGDIPYFMWVALASILANFDGVGGREEFHRISSLDTTKDSRGRAKYNEQATNEKYENVRDNFRSPMTCQRISEEGWTCPLLSKNGTCKKYISTDGRGARTPATLHYFYKKAKFEKSRDSSGYAA